MKKSSEASIITLGKKYLAIWMGSLHENAVFRSGVKRPFLQLRLVRCKNIGMLTKIRPRICTPLLRN